MTIRRAVWGAPVAIGFVGIAAMLTVTGGAAWAFAIGWLVAAAVVGVLELVARTKRTRVFIPTIAIVTLPILAFEGGFFMLPAALALLAAAVIAPGPDSARHTRSPLVAP